MIAGFTSCIWDPQRGSLHRCLAIQLSAIRPIRAVRQPRSTATAGYALLIFTCAELGNDRSFSACGSSAEPQILVQKHWSIPSPAPHYVRAKSPFGADNVIAPSEHRRLQMSLWTGSAVSNSSTCSARPAPPRCYSYGKNETGFIIVVNRTGVSYSGNPLSGESGHSDFEEPGSSVALVRDFLNRSA